jgi:hypothetical protein
VVHPLPLVTSAEGNGRSGCDRPGDHVIEVTPDPIFSGLDGTDKRMLAAVEMFGSVLVLGRVAATYVAA